MRRSELGACFTTAIASVFLCTASASAQNAQVSDGIVRVGVIEDMSGVYADITGKGAVTAAQMAVEDFGGKVLGMPIEVVFADHQNKPDIAANAARKWFDTDK